MNTARALSVAPRRLEIPRPIAVRTRGDEHRGIVRLASPSDLGNLIKPFVFLDAFDVHPLSAPQFGWHPHSGIATLTVVLEGTITYAETTGRKGTLERGAIEWMRAARGVWHSGSMRGDQRVKGFQLWLALGPDLENGPPESRYLNDEDVPVDGPARVVLGKYGAAVSPVPSPPGINYLVVRLAAGQRWTYQPPRGHTVAWIATQSGILSTPETVTAGELAVFTEGEGALPFEALEPTVFVLGSAIKHPHELVLGNYSVHTNPRALASGEAEILRIGRDLVEFGQLAAESRV